MKECDNIRKVTKTERNLQIVKNESEPLYYLSLEFEKGQKKNIPISLNSNPGELAFEFCKVNNLDFASLNSLTLEIENMIKKLSTQCNSMTESQLKKQQEIKEEDMNNQQLISIENRGESCGADKENEKIEKMIDNLTKTKNYSSSLNNMSINSSCLSIQKKLSQNIKENQRVVTLKTKAKLFSYEFDLQNDSSRQRVSQFNQTHTKGGSLQFNKSISSVKPSHSINNSSRVSSCISLRNQSQTIYEKLFQEASYNKVIIKRKCHFSKTKTPYAHVNTIIPTQSSFPFEGCYTQPNYIRNYISTENSKPDCTFKPKISVYQSIDNSSKARNNTRNKGNLISSNEVIQFNNSFRNSTQGNIKPKKTPSNLNDKVNDLNKQFNVYNTINIISSPVTNNKVNNYKENSYLKHYQCNSNPIVPTYLPLRERTCSNSKPTGDSYLENLRKDAFENLFNELLLRNKGDILNKSTLTIQKTSKAILGYIDPIISSIINYDKDLVKEEFVTDMKALFNSLSLDGKRTIVRNYTTSFSITEPNKKKPEIVANQGVTKNDNSVCFFNSKALGYNKLNSIDRRNHGRSHDYALYPKSKMIKENKRNFYYVFDK